MLASEIFAKPEKKFIKSCSTPVVPKAVSRDFTLNVRYTLRALIDIS